MIFGRWAYHILSYATILETPEGGPHFEYNSSVSFVVSMAGGLQREWKEKWKAYSFKDASGIPPYLGIHYSEDNLVDYDSAECTQELLTGLDTCRGLVDPFPRSGQTCIEINGARVQFILHRVCQSYALPEAH